MTPVHACEGADPTHGHGVGLGSVLGSRSQTPTTRRTTVRASTVGRGAGPRRRVARRGAEVVRRGVDVPGSKADHPPPPAPSL